MPYKNNLYFVYFYNSAFYFSTCVFIHALNIFYGIIISEFFFPISQKLYIRKYSIHVHNIFYYIYNLYYICVYILNMLLKKVLLWFLLLFVFDSYDFSFRHVQYSTKTVCSQSTASNIGYMNIYFGQICIRGIAQKYTYIIILCTTIQYTSYCIKNINYNNYI